VIKDVKQEELREIIFMCCRKNISKELQGILGSNKYALECMKIDQSLAIITEHY